MKTLIDIGNACDACRLVESVKTIDDIQLCSDCYTHARKNSLSPREWYGLVTIHGEYPNCLEHYSSTGRAMKTHRRVFDAKQCELPTPQTVMSSLPLMLEYAFFPYLEDLNFFTEMRSRFSVDAITEALSAIVSNRSTWYILSKGVSRVCRFALGADAATWLLSNWDQYASKAPDGFIDAAAHCLPFEQAFDMAKKLLKSHPMHYCAMSSFGSPAVLDWIEENISSPFTPWGVLAAQSQLTWSRAEDWIKRGRPLSLVAINALNSIVSGDDSSIVLHEPAAVDEICSVLESYQKIDTVPNVDFMTSSIIQTLKQQGLVSSQPVPEKKAELIQGRLDRDTNMKSLHVTAFELIKENRHLSELMPEQSEIALMQTKLGGAARLVKRRGVAIRFY